MGSFSTWSVYHNFGCFIPEDNKLGSAVLGVTVNEWVNNVPLCLGYLMGFGYHG